MKGGSSGSGTTTQSGNSTTTTSLPDWVNQASQNNYGNMQNVAQIMAGPYSGERVAGMSDAQLQNIAALQGNVGATNPAYAFAQSGMADLSGYTPQQIQAFGYNPANVSSGAYDPAQVQASMVQAGSYNPYMIGGLQMAGGVGGQSFNPAAGPAMNVNSQQISAPSGIAAQQINPYAVNAPTGVSADQVQANFLSGMNLNPYMNPYTQNVINSSMAIGDQQRQMALNQNADAAIRSGAFAGSRHGVTEGVTNSQYALQAAQLAAQLNQANFGQAQANATNDLNRGLQASGMNQAANLQAGQFNNTQSLQAALANQNNAYNTGLANAQNNLQANQFNNSQQMQASQSNQAADLAAQQAMLSSATGLGQANIGAQSAGNVASIGATAQTNIANLQASLNAQIANQQAATQAGQFNATQGLQAQLANQSAGLQAGLANQGSYNTGQQFNINNALQAGLANQGAYNTAQQQYGQNVMQSQLANQNAGMQGANLNMNALNNLGALSTQGQNSYLNGLQNAIGGNQLQQNQQQMVDQANQQAYAESQQFPIQQMQMLLASLGMSPYGNTTNTTSNMTGTSSVPSNGLMQGLGAAGMLTGIGGNLFGAGGLFPGALAGGGAATIGAGSTATLGSGIPLSALAFSSDRTEKTDIRKIGKDPATDIDIYSYRYKGDPKTYPKVVGPMAQDIEKKFPEMVGTAAGKKVVNANFLAGMGL